MLKGFLIEHNCSQIGDVDCRGDYVYIPNGWGGSDINNMKFSRDR
jgi:hypothetical protein